MSNKNIFSPLKRCYNRIPLFAAISARRAGKWRISALCCSNGISDFPLVHNRVSGIRSLFQPDSQIQKPPFCKGGQVYSLISNFGGVISHSGALVLSEGLYKVLSLRCRKLCQSSTSRLIQLLVYASLLFISLSSSRFSH